MKTGSESGFIFALLPFLFTPGGLKANMLSQRSSLAVEFNLLRFVQPISNRKRKKRGGGLNKSEINKDNFLLVAGCKKAASALAAFHSAGLLAPQAGRVRRRLSGLDQRVASLHFSTGNNPSSRRRLLLACFVHLVQTNWGVTVLRREASVHATKHVVGRGLQKQEVPRGLEVESIYVPSEAKRRHHFLWFSSEMNQSSFHHVHHKMHFGCGFVSRHLSATFSRLC